MRSTTNLCPLRGLPYSFAPGPFNFFLLLILPNNSLFRTVKLEYVRQGPNLQRSRSFFMIKWMTTARPISASPRLPIRLVGQPRPLSLLNKVQIGFQNSYWGFSESHDNFYILHDNGCKEKIIIIINDFFLAIMQHLPFISMLVLPLLSNFISHLNRFLS